MKLSGLTKPSLLLLWSLVLLPFCFTGDSVMELELFSLGSSMVSIIILKDFTSISFSIVIGIVSSMVLTFGDYYMKEDQYYIRFFWVVFLFVVSMNILIFFPSLPLMLLGWDGLGVTSFVLIVYYQNLKSLGAGIHTLLMNRIGDVLILMAFFLILEFGHWNISGLSLLGGAVSLVIIVGSMTKSAQVPFSSWLPAAMAAPTPVSALVHSSTLVTAGIYLIIRFYPFLSMFEMKVLLFCSVFTALLGGWGACYENDLKKVIALSTLSQLGVMMFSLSLGYPMLCLFHLYTHALFKSLLFICAGHIIHSCTGSQDIRQMSSLFIYLPFTVAIFNLGNLCLMGFPFLSGFFSKDTILEMMLLGPCNSFMTILMFVATCFTVVYTFRLLSASIWGFPKFPVVLVEGLYQLFVPMSILGSLAIISGAGLSSTEYFTEFIWLPTKVKLILLIPFIALILSKHSVSGVLKHFLGSMWFLPSLFTVSPIVYISSQCKKINFHLEKGWLEPIHISYGANKVKSGSFFAQIMFVFFIVYFSF